ncbi:MAG: ABC transporter ATP-binding protein [Alphaproteobacteria bacterium]|nr:ABC transporter ATP-binding protein [Alphaproteobacteria bacterium]
MTQTPLISIRNLHKRFGSNQVLKGINLDVYKGDSLVIIGGSGTGKSVLIKCILGLIEPDKGEIEIDDMNLQNASRREKDALMKRMSMLFQGSGLFDSLNIWENIAFGLLHNTSMKRSEAKDLALEKMASVGLKPEVADLSPAEISGGMKRRVALARAIIQTPEIIFFDEPTTGLDPIMSTVINNLIIKSISTIGATGITITHDMQSARQISNRIAMIYDGQIIWDGPSDQIEKTQNPYVDQFVHGLSEGPIDVVKT